MKNYMYTEPKNGNFHHLAFYVTCKDLFLGIACSLNSD